MKIATTYIQSGRTFYIVYFQDRYCAIEDCFVDPATGRLTKEMNGLEMAASDSIQECINIIRDRVTLDDLKKSGLSTAEALGVIYNWTPEQVKAFEAIAG